jgi:hypothetical protein
MTGTDAAVDAESVAEFKVAAGPPLVYYERKSSCELHAVNCAFVQGLQRTQLRADYLLAKRLAEELPPVPDEDDEDQRADADGDDLDEPDGDEPDGDEPDDDEPDDDEGPRVVGVDDGSYAW